MEKAILGTKLGMTQVFNADGTVTPVTVILAGPCTVVQKKTVDKDGYDAKYKKMNISLNRAKEGKYTGEGNITYKGEKGKEGFTKVQIIEDTVEDKKENKKNEENENENKNEEKKEEEEKEEIKEEKKNTRFKKIQIIEED